MKTKLCYAFASLLALSAFLFGQVCAAEPAQAKLPEDVELREVTIFSDGTRMTGDLYLPKNRKAEEKLPAIVICAGTGGAKRGTGGRLGVIFTRAGYVALAFDYRGWGGSDSKLITLEKQPSPDANGLVSVKARAVRWQMDFADQAQDIRAAISLIAGEPGVDKERIGIFGTSYGGGLVTWTAGNDPRVKCTVAQVPGMGAASTPQALARQFEYLSKQTRGEVEPVPFETGKMTGNMARYTQMRVNPTKRIGYSPVEAAEKITTPILFVVAEKEELSDNANVARVQQSIARRGVPTTYHVIKGITHYGVYREGFEEATRIELDWFNRHLKALQPAQSKDEPKKSALSKEPALIKGCEEPSRAAIKVLDEFMDGFNSKDIKKFEASYNFPHVRLAGGRVTTLEGPSNRQQIFEGLDKSIGWDYTRYDERQIIQCGPDKVHVAVRVTRYRKDQTPIHTFDSLYIVTNQNGKLGIQMRSGYAPER